MLSKGPLRFERVWLVLLLALLLVLRLGALDAFLTTDEALWRERGHNFGEALRQHDWAATYQAGHPGVITMWLGAIADRFEFVRAPSILEGTALRQLLRDPAPAPGTGIPPVTLGARRLLALVTWLGLLALYPLLRRLLGPRVALLAIAFVGLDPFLLAHSRFHHLDGLLATFAMLSIVALLAYRFSGQRWLPLLASAATAGLAMANKSPGVLLVPWAAVVLVGLPILWPQASRRREALRGLGALALWGAAAALVVVALWPALWVDPTGTLKNVFGVAQYYAETPHEFASFFMGAAVPDPGPLFYPVVWAFRTTPVVVLGLAALVITWRDKRLRGIALLSLLWVGLYAAAMTVGEKKFDRYLLPVFPVLDILAALGWVALLERCLRHPRAHWAQWGPVAASAVLAVAALALVWPSRPYYISYYNPLLGGAPAASKVLRVGWGEGLDLAAAFLNRQPDAEDSRVIVWSFQDFLPFFRGHNVGGAEAVPLAEADYYVFYINELQRGLAPAAQYFVGQQDPAYVATLGGLDYAWVYRNTYYEDAAAQVFGQIDREADPQRDVILFDVDAAIARHYDGPLPVRILNGGAREDYVLSGLQRLVAGSGRVWHVTFTDQTPAIAPVIDDCLGRYGERAEEYSAGGLSAVRYDLAPGTRFVPEAPVTLDARFGDDIRLLGYETSARDLQPGQTVRITLYWQATGPIGTSYTVFTHLRDGQGTMQDQSDSPPAGGQRVTADWQPGEVVLDERELHVPDGAPAGPYTIAVGLYDRTTMERLVAFDGAGNPLADRQLVIEGWQVAAGQGS